MKNYTASSLNKTTGISEDQNQQYLALTFIVSIRFWKITSRRAQMVTYASRKNSGGAKVDGARRKPPVFNYQVKCLGWVSDEYFKLDIAARPSTAGHWLRGVKLTCLIIKIFC